MTYAGTTITLYLDGVSQATATASGNGNAGTTDGTAAGVFYRDASPAAALDGKMAHFCVYNASIGAGRMANLRWKRPPDNDPNLVLYWPMDERGGGTVFDRAGTQQNGSITTPLWLSDHPPTGYK